MTPTEQDKELRDRVVTAVAEANLMALQEKHPIDTVETLGPVASDMANQLVDQLITADRERVALAAEIELINNMLNSNPVILHDCGGRLVGVFSKTYLEHKKSELKAQQEEV